MNTEREAALATQMLSMLEGAEFRMGKIHNAAHWRRVIRNVRASIYEFMREIAVSGSESRAEIAPTAGRDLTVTGREDLK